MNPYDVNAAIDDNIIVNCQQMRGIGTPDTASTLDSVNTHVEIKTAKNIPSNESQSVHAVDRQSPNKNNTSTFLISLNAICAAHSVRVINE